MRVRAQRLQPYRLLQKLDCFFDPAEIPEHRGKTDLRLRGSGREFSSSSIFSFRRLCIPIDANEDLTKGGVSFGGDELSAGELEGMSDEEVRRIAETLGAPIPM